jgi:hypothetical protein
LTKDTPNHTAASEYIHRTTYTKAGDKIVTKGLKLRDPISAIAELNKMEKIYTDGSSDKPLLMQSFVFVLPDGTQVKPSQLVSIQGKETPLIAEHTATAEDAHE